MRLRVIITALILLLNIVLQSTVLHYIEVRGVIPNTMVIIIVSYALLRGSTEGAIVGIAAGLIYDMLYGQSIGYYALLGMGVGYFCGMSFHSFYRENYILPLLLSIAATFLYENAVYITGFFFSGQLNYLNYLLSIIFPRTVYTAVFSLIIYRLLFGVNDWIESKEKRNRYRY